MYLKCTSTHNRRFQVLKVVKRQTMVIQAKDLMDMVRVMAVDHQVMVADQATEANQATEADQATAVGPHQEAMKALVQTTTRDLAMKLHLQDIHHRHHQTTDLLPRPQLTEVNQPLMKCNQHPQVIAQEDLQATALDHHLAMDRLHLDTVLDRKLAMDHLSQAATTNQLVFLSHPFTMIVRHLRHTLASRLMAPRLLLAQDQEVTEHNQAIIV